MTPTELFVYGTLRHDQPEHAKYCRGVTSWRPARMQGRLVRLVEGYRLIVVPPGAILLRASPDANADEHRRAALAGDAVVRAALAAAQAAGRWIDGELLTFREAAEAWPPLDAWENFTPGQPGIYPRVVVPIELSDDDDKWRSLAAWTYGATVVPAGATEVRAIP